jgi:hypothetical protein
MADQTSGEGKTGPDESASPPPAAAQNSCPNCGKALAAEAVLCINCGFNRQTGKQLETVKKRYEGHWDNVRLPLWGRLLAFAISVAVLWFGPFLFGMALESMFRRVLFTGQGLDLLDLVVLLTVAWMLFAYGIVPTVCAAPMLYALVSPDVILFVVWGILLLLIGSFRRTTIARDLDGRPILTRRQWICFLPRQASVTNLKDYRRIHTNVRPSGSAVTVVLVFFLGGLPWLLYALIRGMHGPVVTLEIVGGPGGPTVEPVLVYRGTSEATMREIGETLQAVAGLQYD